MWLALPSCIADLSSYLDGGKPIETYLYTELAEWASANRKGESVLELIPKAGKPVWYVTNVADEICKEMEEQAKTFVKSRKAEKVREEEKVKATIAAEVRDAELAQQARDERHAEMEAMVKARKELPQE